MADDAAHPRSAARGGGARTGRHPADPAAAAKDHKARRATPAGASAFRRQGAVLRGTSRASIDRDRIAVTERLIRPHIRHTPVIRVDAADFGLAGEPLTFKLEFLQHTGSFKPRGAFANLLTREAPAAGVVAASGGNHGAAVAYAAMRLGLRATIFVPTVASPAKLDRIRGYGAELVVGGERYADALAASEDFARRTGALPVHAYDQPETLLGQGTVGFEIEADMPDIDTLLVATGGGGLIGGIAAWYEGRVRVVSIEPELAPTLHDALHAGRPVDAPAGGIAADSLAPRQVGQLMFAIAQRFVERAVLVSDDTIRDAQRRLWDVLRIAAEPGGAAALAALISGRYQPAPGERVAVLLCGANTTAVDFDRA
jgi:threonine dehydratase